MPKIQTVTGRVKAMMMMLMMMIRKILNRVWVDVPERKKREPG